MPNINRNKHRDLYAYRKKAAALRRTAERENLPCWICGEPIDFTAPARTRLAFSADHVIPINKGGGLAFGNELRPAHHSCNSRRGDGSKGKKRVINKPKTTRLW